jgi:hypothetical protein
VATLQFFGKIGANIFGGETGAESEKVDWITDTIKVQLHTAATSFAYDTDEVAADVINEVANGNGYTTGGYTLLSPTVTYSGTGNTTVLDAADPTWTASGAGFSASDAVFVDTTPDLLIGTLAFGSTITLASGDTLTINIDATNGVFYVTAPGS